MTRVAAVSILDERDAAVPDADVRLPLALRRDHRAPAEDEVELGIVHRVLHHRRIRLRFLRSRAGRRRAASAASLALDRAPVGRASTALGWRAPTLLTKLSRARRNRTADAVQVAVVALEDRQIVDGHGDVRVVAAEHTLLDGERPPATAPGRAPAGGGAARRPRGRRG